MKNINTKFVDAWKFTRTFLISDIFLFKPQYFSAPNETRGKHHCSKENILRFHLHCSSHDKHINKAFCGPTPTANVPRFSLHQQRRKIWRDIYIFLSSSRVLARTVRRRFVVARYCSRCYSRVEECVIYFPRKTRRTKNYRRRLFGS